MIIIIMLHQLFIGLASLFSDLCESWQARICLFIASYTLSNLTVDVYCRCHVVEGESVSRPDCLWLVYWHVCPWWVLSLSLNERNKKEEEKDKTIVIRVSATVAKKPEAKQWAETTSTAQFSWHTLEHLVHRERETNLMSRYAHGSQVGDVAYLANKKWHRCCCCHTTKWKERKKKP